MYSLANLTVRHYVELTVFEGKLGRYLMLPFLKLRFFLTCCILKVKEKEDSIQMRIVFNLDPYYQKSIQLVPKEGQFYIMTLV